VREGRGEWRFWLCVGAGWLQPPVCLGFKGGFWGLFEVLAPGSAASLGRQMCTHKYAADAALRTSLSIHLRVNTTQGSVGVLSNALLSAVSADGGGGCRGAGLLERGLVHSSGLPPQTHHPWPRLRCPAAWPSQTTNRWQDRSEGAEEPHGPGRSPEEVNGTSLNPGA
jgi:hypothetical protein